VNSLKRRTEQDGKTFFAISSVTGSGVTELMQAVKATLEQLQAQDSGNEAVELVL